MSARPTPTTSIRLAGVSAPVSLSLLDHEREALERAAGDRQVSAWARLVLDAASESSGAGSASAAADAARMPLRAWVRVVLLEAAGVTDLRGQLTRARRAGVSRG